MSNFIRCSDPDTIDKLTKAGFHKIKEDNGVAVFINDAKKLVNFDKTKVAFTNIITAS